MTEPTVTIDGGHSIDVEVSFYASAGFLAYVQNIDVLMKTMNGAHCVVQTRRGDRLIGLARPRREI
jgi:hypothetical protein